MEKPSMYCLLDVGLKIIERHKLKVSQNIFVYPTCPFYFLLICDRIRNVKQFLTDINKCDEFSLQVRTNHMEPDKEYLSLFLNVKIDQQYYSDNKNRIVDLLFEKFDPMDVKMDDSIEEDGSQHNENSVQTLYSRLKAAHSDAEIFKGEEELDLATFQHPMMRAQLRPYQAKAVKWMINQETEVKSLQIPFLELRPLSSQLFGQVFYMDRYTWKITDYLPKQRLVPQGGLLCDEMGLGKTVEMLSLILHRRSEQMETNQQSNEVFTNDDFKKYALDKNDSKMYQLHCICITASTSNRTILCNSCKRLQHIKCVMKNAIYKHSLENYRCPDCWQKSGILVDSKTTLIVSPLSIKQQWHSEIQKHVRDENFRVFIYEGVKITGWISPDELAQYDVVLTDYNVLTSEIFFTRIEERKLRHERRHANPVSPLPLVHWYRTCLDEAQMVETPTTQSAKMVNSLPAKYRWAVTGTPIEKNISTLYGLIYFLDFDPYSISSVWKENIQMYLNGNYKPVINILQKVMWRTCKVDVVDELGIPPQSELVHYVVLSDLQTFFYRNEHAQYQRIFFEKSSKLINSQLSVSRMSAHTFKLLMEPLRKLRQDCVVPSITRANNNMEQNTKKLLSPKELHDHLISSTEAEAKTCLRTIASSSNGMAACHVMRNNHQVAIDCYKNVLQLASEYNDKKIHVDTLLQIHAVHNMLDISKKLSKFPEKSLYENKLGELEWKYIESYKDKVKEVEDRLQIATVQIKVIGLSGLSERGDAWWRQVLYDSSDIGKENLLIEKIQLDLKDQGFNMNINTLRGTDLIMTTWIDKVNNCRRDIIQAFHDLAYFHKNLKPKHQLTEDELFKVEYLTKTAYHCHLFTPEEDSDAENLVQRPNGGKLCQMCRVKSKLNDYECEIFNKHRLLDKKDDPQGMSLRGSWNPRAQEYAMKTMLAFAKKEGYSDDVIKAGEAELKLLDALKTEFKEFSQYWVEINYTVSAYDELTMCKSRLQAIDINDENSMAVLDARKVNMQIPRHMIDIILQEMISEKNNAELTFVRTKGRLKYLSHLKDEKEIEVCPICKQQPEEKYAVLQCGHLMCYICTTQMAKYQRNKLQCAVCRHPQLYKDVLYVTMNDTETETTIQGSFSTKILFIIKQILKIRSKEPDVKIVIFSQWEAILRYLENALEINQITYVLRTANNRHHDPIEDFKDYSKNITCLLLPLASGSKGLNLTEATHVFLVEPILDPGEELQAIGRVHRIGQTRPTFVHRFIVQNTIEETIYKTILNDESGIWKTKEMTVDDLKKLFDLEQEDDVVPMES